MKKRKDEKQSFWKKMLEVATTEAVKFSVKGILKWITSGIGLVLRKRLLEWFIVFLLTLFGA